jgi:hypothetical protein
MSEEGSEKIPLKIPLLVSIFIILAWILTWYLLKDQTDRGTFGDMFGSVNAIFSGLAFVGVIYAILLQSKELQLQRRELRFTREELEGQKMQMEAQNATLIKQNFENTFFELLKIHNDITNGIDLSGSNNRVTKGRDCFKVFYKRFKTLWGRKKEKYDGVCELDRVSNTYLAFYQEHEAEFGHYFRSLYNIVKLVDSSDMENKRFYTNFLRAQLSSFELTLLFYNSLSDLGREKFKPLIEKYSLLKNVPKNEILNSSEHLSLFSSSAY